MIQPKPTEVSDLVEATWLMGIHSEMWMQADLTPANISYCLYFSQNSDHKKSEPLIISKTHLQILKLKLLSLAWGGGAWA